MDLAELFESACVAGLAVAEAEVFTYNDGLGVQALDNDLGDKLLRREMG